MTFKKTKMAFCSIVAVTALMFAACGDDSSSAEETKKFATEEDLPESCNDGEDAEVGKGVFYTCKDGKWVSEDQVQSSSSVGKNETSSENKEETKPGSENTDGTTSSASNNSSNSTETSDNGCGTIDENKQFCFEGKAYDLCSTKPYIPGTEKCMYGIVTPIKDGNDTLYKEVNNYGGKFIRLFYTDGLYAYKVEEDIYESEGGFITASSYAKEYANGNSSRFGLIMSASSVEVAVSNYCREDVPCVASYTIEYYAVKALMDGDKNYEVILNSDNYSIRYIWKTKFNDKYTMDDFTDAFAKHSCAGEEYYPQEKFCYNGTLYSFNPIEGGDNYSYCTDESGAISELLEYPKMYTMFCYKGKGYPYCGGQKYVPVEGGECIDDNYESGSM